MPDASSQGDTVFGVAHFRVRRGDRVLLVQSVSALHDAVAGEGGDERRGATPLYLTLSRAITTDRTLYTWYRECVNGKTDTAQPVTIDLLGTPGGPPVNRWELVNARPVRWSGPAFDAGVSAPAIEQIELQYDAIRWLDL